MINPGFEVGKRYVIWSSKRGKTDIINIGTVELITNYTVIFKNDTFHLEYFDSGIYYENWYCFEEITKQQELALVLKAKEVKYV